VFGTASKQTPHAARGVEMAREAARSVSPRPLIAIGGFDAAGAPLAHAASRAWR
jgi:thiamine monophosphate synthase